MIFFPPPFSFFFLLLLRLFLLLLLLLQRDFYVFSKFSLMRCFIFIMKTQTFLFFFKNLENNLVIRQRLLEIADK